MHPITSEDEKLAEVAAELGSRLVRLNEAVAGPSRTRHIALTVRNDKGAVIAGLVGEALWNALYVYPLWVDERYRQLTYGTALLRRAEDLAIEKSCSYVCLSTFDFQAPAFSTALGYSVIGELPTIPAGSRRQWLCGSLRRILDS